MHHAERIITYTYAANNNRQTRNGNEEAQVSKWLWQSLTFHIINEDSGDGDVVVDGKYSPQTDGHYLDTQSEWITARAWCQWITRFSKGRNRNGSRGDNAYQLTYGTIKCSAVNAAKNQVFGTIDREEDGDSEDKMDDESSWAGDNATTKTTKLIELYILQLMHGRTVEEKRKSCAMYYKTNCPPRQHWIISIPRCYGYAKRVIEV